MFSWSESAMKAKLRFYKQISKITDDMLICNINSRTKLWQTNSVYFKACYKKCNYINADHIKLSVIIRIFRVCKIFRFHVQAISFTGTCKGAAQADHSTWTMFVAWIFLLVFTRFHCSTKHIRSTFSFIPKNFISSWFLVEFVSMIEWVRSNCKRRI